MHERTLKKLRKVSLGILVCFAILAPLLIHAQPIPGIPSTPPSGSAPNPGAAANAFTIDFNFGCDGTFSCMAAALKQVPLWILLGLGKLLAILLNLGAVAAEYMMGYGQAIIRLPVVENGFRLTLSLTNLFFVIAILVIAFATMFRLEKYGAKKMLPRLIIAAVLINFSLLIAGLFIGASNIFTQSFMQNLNANEIGAAFSPQTLLTVSRLEDFGIVSSTSTSQGDPYSGIRDIGNNKDGTRRYQFEINEGDRGWQTYFKILQALALAVIMTAILAVVVIAIAVMILIRNIWLAVLLIFMPLIWIFALIPYLQEYASKWWSNFIKWIIYLPAVSFFMMLSIATTKVTALNGGLFGSDFAANVIQMLILAGLLVASLKIGKAFGMIGAAATGGIAGFALKSLAGAGKFTAKKTAQGAASLATVPVAAGVATAGAPFGKAGVGKKFLGAKTAGKTIAQGTSTILSRVPGLKGTANKLAGVASREKEVEERQKTHYSKLTDAQFKAVLQSRAPMGDVERAAILKEAIKRKAVGDIKEDQRTSYAEALTRLHPGTEQKDIEEIKSMVNVNPAMLPDLIPVAREKDEKTGELESQEEANAREIKKWVEKMNGEKLKELDTDALADGRIAAALSKTQISTIIRSGSAKHEEKLREGIGKIEESFAGELDVNTKQTAHDLGRLAEQIKTAEEEYNDAKGTANAAPLKAALKALRDKKKNVLTSITDKKIRNKIEQIANAPDKARYIDQLITPE